jgi:hypothetical protein
VYTNSDGTYNVDTNSSPKECAQTQGNWAPPGYQYAVDSNGNVSCGLSGAQCSLMNQGLNEMTDIVTVAAVIRSPYTIPLGTGASLMTKTNQYLNNQLCGGPSMKLP